MFAFRVASVASLALILGCASSNISSVQDGPIRASDATRKELAPTGKLRVSVLISPSPGTLLSTRRADGTIEGVTTTLGTALATEIGVPVELVPVTGLGGLFDSLTSRQADVTFTNADASRRKDVEYGPRYAKTDFTFLVSGKSGINSFEEINRPNMRLLVSNNSPFTSALRARFPNAQFVQYGQLDEGARLFAEGKADALFFGRVAIDTLATRIPDSKVLGPSFVEQDNVIAVQSDRPLAKAYVVGFIERAKNSGLVRKALDDAGLRNTPVAR